MKRLMFVFGAVFDGTWIDYADHHGRNRMGTFHAVRRTN